MLHITATVIYYTPGRFGPVQHTRGRETFFTVAAVRAACRNADSVLSRSGADHIVLDADAGLAVQVSGYNFNRGMYCDVLPLEELRPFLPSMAV